MTSPRWWTVRELAEHYRVSAHKIYVEIAAGRLQAIRFPYRVRDDWRQDWEDSRRTVAMTEEKRLTLRQKPLKHVTY